MLKRRTTLSPLLLSLLFGCSDISLVTDETNDAVQQTPTTDDQSDTSQSTEPNLTVNFSQTPDTTTHLRYAQFQFSAPDAASYECSLNSEPPVACSSPFYVAEVSASMHSFSVQAIDEQGQKGEVADYQWTIDNDLLLNDDDLTPTNVYPDQTAAHSWRGIFRINCDFSHSSYNDPIVYPGEENVAHLHRFYGNTLVDHTTTTESLYTQGESSCQGNKLNLSSYWLPALLAPHYDESGNRILDDSGEPAWQVVPAVVGNDDVAHEVFYYSAGIDDLDAIQPLPAGLKMIAGNHMTQPGVGQEASVVRWHCQSWESDDANNPQFSASIPQCYEPDRLRLDIFFPSCWNGEDLDSDDHKSHMAYPVDSGTSAGTVCPTTHPVPVVRVSYHYAFGVKPEWSEPVSRSTLGWRLASDMYEVNDTQAGGFSLHADWFNGWHPGLMEMLLDNCIKQGLDCHDGNLANGYRLSGTQPSSQVEPAIINQGMGN